ncbi:Cytochrome c [Rosistilla carotiformis]|uniref:Cytochrome c n=1 Tax=Rosistilla carotiformis TaxID=2528017 RepID=A0A518JV14_9BACT|nr:PVC-type heme-binding CxxCH protein [Rosistilla carotiformis]QDV69369.1 Cytochrome c [Rosistilla carotiformis]
MSHLFRTVPFAVALLLAQTGLAQQEPIRGNKPLSPQESAAQFEIHPDVQIELVACEPQVVDPVATAFDDQGRLWVVEMRDYPLGPADGQPPQSRIQLLRDRDGDGFYEHATTFANELVFPTGVQPWRGGVIVTLAGKVMFMADTDGDDVCDLQETWFEGFMQENTQLRANHPALMVDNKIHVSNGLRGGTVQSTDKRWQPVKGEPAALPLQGKDFAFDALGGTFVGMPGNGQFGFSEDDFGNIFLCTNRNPCIHVALDGEIIASDPWLTPRDAVHDAVIAGEASRVYSLAEAWTTSNLHAGQFTAACGVHVFGGTGLPGEMLNNAFTCEPTGYLVQRQVMRPDGLTFAAKRGREEVEFLASHDAWFRPVNLNSGPDGALYVVDMYRAVIEHPQFVPEELKNRPDQRWGTDKGRIWRVSSKTKTPTAESAASMNWNDADAAALVGALDHPNRWHRSTAQRLILEQIASDSAAFVAGLQTAATTAESPAARVRALWLLDAISKLPSQDATVAADFQTRLVDVIEKDKDFRVRRHAVELLSADNPQLPTALQAALTTDDPVLQAVAWRRLVLTSGKPISVPAALIQAACSDDLLRAYLMVPAVGGQCVQTAMLLDLLQPKTAGGTPSIDTLAIELARRVGYYGSTQEIGQILDRVSADQLGMQIVRGLHEGVVRGRRNWSQSIASDGVVHPGFVRIQTFAKSIAEDEAASASVRTDALNIVRLDRSDDTTQMLVALFESEAPTAVRSSAIDGLAAVGDPEFAHRILRDPSRFPPALLRSCVSALLRRPEWTSAMLDALETGKLAPAALDLSQTNRLRNHSDKKLAGRAQTLMASLSADRQAVIDRYSKAMAGEGNSNAGKLIFAQQCAACHVMQGKGHAVGPDISDSRTKTPEQLLVSILNPGAAIDANYFRYTVVTLDGQVLDGLLVEETANAITLKQAEGKMTTIDREDIDQARTTSVSLMPEGFEQQISPEQMRDLIAYIKNWRYLSGAIPGVATGD